MKPLARVFASALRIVVEVGSKGVPFIVGECVAVAIASIILPDRILS